MVHKIITDLSSLATPLGEIEFDPQNAKRHPPAQLEQYRRSLDLYGQRRPVVVNKRSGHLIAGEGLVVAARGLGWSHVAAVFVDDEPHEAIGYALADNRVGDLGEWDGERLAENVRQLDEEGWDVIGFSDEEVAELLKSLEPPSPEPPATPKEAKAKDEPKGAGEERTAEPKDGGVKVYQLFVDGADAEDFDAGTRNLGKRWGLDNLTDILTRAVREQDGLA